MRTWALIPVRSFSTGKSRLGALGPSRAEVARALFDHVHRVVAGSGLFAGVLVATDGADVAALADDVLVDEGPRPLAAIVDRGLTVLAARGADAAVVVMADLPLLAAADLARMIGALAEADVVAAADRDHLGTNALGLRLPAPPTCFGNPDSYHRHVAAARAGALRLATIDRDGLAFDVDGPSDLDDLTAEAKPRIGGEPAVGAEPGVGVFDTIERIRRRLVDEGTAHLIERRALGRDAAGRPRGTA